MKEVLIAIAGLVLGVVLIISYGNAAENQDKSIQKLIWALLILLGLIACIT